MTTTQKGSAHVIIIVVLVVALIAALGWIFWQNVVNQDQAKTDSSSTGSKRSSAKTAPASQEMVSLPLTNVFANGVSLNYPEGWKVTHKTPTGDLPPKDDGATDDTYVLTSSDNAVDLMVGQNSGGGIGGACDSADSPKISTFSYEASTVWPKRSYYDSVVASDGSFVVAQGLSDLARAKTIKAGDSICDMMTLDITDTGRTAGASTAILLFTSISAHGQDKQVTFSSLDGAKSYLSSQNAKDVKSILLSIK